jgi:phage baseplate assembly protein W
MGAQSYLGRGPQFPILPAARGRIPYVEGPDKIQQSIVMILMTQPGERVMRPHFGCGLQRYLMQPNTLTTRTMIERDVERALRIWEPRIAISEVQVNPGREPALVTIVISYTHVRDGKPGNLSFSLKLE